MGLVAENAVDHVGPGGLQPAGDVDVRLLVEAGHQFHHHRDFLALLRRPQQRLHQHGIDAGAIDGHLDRHHLRVVRGLLQQVDHGTEGLEGMVQQDIGLAHRGEDVALLLQCLGHARPERAELQVRPVHPVGHLDQAHHVDQAMDPVQILLAQAELLEQEVGHRLGAVVGHLQPHRVAEVALRQFALQRDAQVLHLFLVDEQVRIAGHAELVAAEHIHAREQFVDMGVQHRGQENVAVVQPGERLRQPDHPRQRARRLDDGIARAAAEGVAAFQLDGEVQALVQHPREGVRRVESDRGEHRHHLAEEVLAYPGALRLVPLRAAQEYDALLGERRHEHVVPQGILLGHQTMGLVADLAEGLGRRAVVAAGMGGAELDLLLEAGHADLEEFVQIARHDADETQAFEQRHGRIGGLRQHAPVEGERGEFAVQKMGELEVLGL